MTQNVYTQPKGILFGSIFSAAFGFAWILQPLLAYPMYFKVAAVLLGLVALYFVFTGIIKFASVAKNGPSLSSDSKLNIKFNITFFLEFVFIFLAIQACRLADQPYAIPAAIAIVVGLHFLPLAKLFALAEYNILAIKLIIAGVIGLLLVILYPENLFAQVFADFGASIALITTAISLRKKALKS